MIKLPVYILSILLRIVIWNKTAKQVIVMIKFSCL